MTQFCRTQLGIPGTCADNQARRRIPESHMRSMTRHRFLDSGLGPATAYSAGVYGVERARADIRYCCVAGNACEAFPKFERPVAAIGKPAPLGRRNTRYRPEARQVTHLMGLTSGMVVGDIGAARATTPSTIAGGQASGTVIASIAAGLPGRLGPSACGSTGESGSLWVTRTTRGCPQPLWTRRSSSICTMRSPSLTFLTTSHLP
jgi:hypothetical protein